MSHERRTSPDVARDRRIRRTVAPIKALWPSKAEKVSAVQRAYAAYREAQAQYFAGTLTAGEVGILRHQWCEACREEVNDHAYERKAMEMTGFVQQGRRR